jgi:hypothetical protein
MTARSDTGESGGRAQRGTVLIADMPQAIETFRRALDGDDIVYLIATTFDEGRRLLRPGLAIILCGVHFDDDRMFDFLRLAKITPHTANVPFVCVRALGLLLKPLVPRGIEVASRELGAAAYVDHLHLENTHGSVEVDRRLRSMLIEARRP